MSAVTKPSLPPNNNQQGTSTKAKEAWSSKPVKCDQDVLSTPPTRASSSGSSSEPAVSISLLLFGPLDQLVSRCRSELLPHFGARRGEAAPQGTENGSPDPTSLS